jgi:hypothetical protein
MMDFIPIIGELVKQNGPISLLLALLVAGYSVAKFLFRFSKKHISKKRSLNRLECFYMDYKVMKEQMAVVDELCDNIIQKAMNFYFAEAKKFERDPALAPLWDYIYGFHIDKCVKDCAKPTIRAFCRENHWDQKTESEYKLLKEDRTQKAIGKALAYIKQFYIPGSQPSCEYLINADIELMRWVEDEIEKTLDRCREIGQRVRRGELH